MVGVAVRLLGACHFTGWSRGLIKVAKEALEACTACGSVWLLCGS